MGNEEQTEWGIPDWRDAKGYLRGDIGEPSLFAWEFLRRSLEYRKTWDDWNQVLQRHGIPLHQGTIEITDDSSTDLLDIDPPARAGETLGEYNSRVAKNTRFTYRWRGFALAEEWGVPMFQHLNPRHPAWHYTDDGAISLNGELLLSFGRGLPKHYAGLVNGKPRQVKPPKENQALVLFDLTEHIDDQLEGAKKVLQNLQKSRGIENPRPPQLRRSLFPLYLRTLDGRRADAPFKEIAKVLLPEAEEASAVKRLEKAHQAAEKLISGEWKRLYRMSSKTRKRGK